ncbi:MAG: RNA 3'-terminal phosphate cyclase [Planctomycetota bacterium]
MITIDGAQGEGGGQILRSSLALSMITGQPFRITNIRANRPKPGLLRQHLTSVEAACAVCGGEAPGAELGSDQLTFTPSTVRGGTYEFAIGTAGSTTLVLQSVLLALIAAADPSSLTITGGTHNTNAPSVHFLRRAFLPLLNRMGPTVKVELERHGFYPAGGGCIRVNIDPATHLSPIDITEAGPILRRRAIATVAGIAASVATRELRIVRDRLGWSDDELHTESLDDSVGPGNVLSLEIQREGTTEVFTGFGERRVSAETVARRAVDEAADYLAAGVPVWNHLADQLMLPLALAGGGRFKTTKVTVHSNTNARIIETFLPVRVRRIDAGHGQVIVSIDTEQTHDGTPDPPSA